jgi:[protein-PII] uridylyltransferase
MPSRMESEVVAREPEDGGRTPPASFVDAFTKSMPARYRVLFDPRAMRLHAAVSYRRRARFAHAELWRALPDGSGGLCIVADDRPGLLALISTALVSHRLDIITALVFSRDAGEGKREAVDLFWVRRADTHDTTSIEPSEAESIGQVLSALLDGSMSVDALVPRAPSTPPPADADTIVHFEEHDEDGLAVMTIDALDRPGMLLAISRALFTQRAQIVRSLVRTAHGRVHNRFELAEFDGSAITPERREAICAIVRGAVAHHSAPKHDA